MTIHDMLNSEPYQCWESERLGNNLLTSDPARATRIRQYARNGLNGSTHAETLEDWRDYIDAAPLSDCIKVALLEEMASVEKWHTDNGTLERIIG